MTIATRDGKTATMTPFELIGRFLLHVLPRGFVKVRHYGLMASANVNTKLEAARRLLDVGPPRADVLETEPADWRALVEQLTGDDLHLCPACGSAEFFSFAISPARPRAPPAAASVP